jgi:hypothetical protein
MAGKNGKELFIEWGGERVSKGPTKNCQPDAETA